MALSIRKNGATTDTELRDIEERLNDITEGEWTRYHDEGAPMNILGVLEDGQAKSIGEFYSDEDARFAEHAPNDIRRLLDEVERLRNALQDIINTPSDWKDSYSQAYSACIRKALEALK